MVVQLVMEVPVELQAAGTMQVQLQLGGPVVWVEEQVLYMQAGLLDITIVVWLILRHGRRPACRL